MILSDDGTGEQSCQSNLCIALLKALKFPRSVRRSIPAGIKTMASEHHDNKIVLLTGGTSGIGRAAARQLANRGATVLVTGRRREKGKAALAEIRDAHPAERGGFYQVDFADLDAVRQLAADVEADYDGLDILFNNAGTVEPTRTLTDDGIEKTFAVNYVAPFVLTNLLVQRLSENPPGRVVNTVTVAQHDRAVDMQSADLSDLTGVATGDYDVDQGETLGEDDTYDPERAYVNSKLALLLFTYELAARLDGTGVTVACFHPGLIGSTDAPRDMSLRSRLIYRAAGILARIARVGELETEVGAGKTMAHHALDRELTEGEGSYFDKRDRVDPGPRAHDEALRETLWEFTADLTNWKKPTPPA